MRYAQTDYDAAKNMSILHNPIPLEIVCYHCQQSAEKILKAYLLAMEEPLIKTHDILILLKRCIEYDNEFNIFVDICPSLTTYAIYARYPIGEDALNENDMHGALKNSLFVLEFTKNKIYSLDIKE